MVKKTREGILFAQNNKRSALKDLTKVEKIILKNLHRKAFDDVHKSFTNNRSKDQELGDDIAYWKPFADKKYFI